MSEKFTAILLKADMPDSNGVMYSKEALEKAVKEYNKNHMLGTATSVHKMKVKVDYDSYCIAYSLKQEIVRTSWVDCKNWVEMEVTSEQLKDMIDKCVNIKIVE